jgi:hypothetical protein
MRRLAGVSLQALPDDILGATEPVVLEGLVGSWPLVQAARTSLPLAVDYLRRFYRGAHVDAFLGAPEHGGSFFYNDDITGFNFHTERVQLDAVLDAMVRYAQHEKPPALYVGSATVDACLPGFVAENHVNLGDRDPLVTLFPPEALENLYIGPLDFTPAGQPVSLVDFSNPDLRRFPKFAQAMDSALVAELGPGDAIFIPSMWWHRVESLDSFNVLVNYWWRQPPDYMDNAMNALMLALLSVRDLPKAQRTAWSQLFNHYVFEPTEQTASHIPEHARRILGPMNADMARMLRAQILRKLNR